MSEEDDGWEKWSNLVLSDLSRLNNQFTGLNSELVRIQLRLEGFQFTRLMHDLEDVAGKLSELDTKLILLDDKLSGETGLIKKSMDFETRIRALEKSTNKNAGRNMVIAGIITMILSATVSAFVSSVRDQVTHKNLPEESDK